MTFADLAAALKATTVNGQPTQWRPYGWDTAPAGDWGIYAADGEQQEQADNRYAESTTVGVVDYYTKSADGAAKAAIESTFKALQEQGLFAWYLNTVQYEADTHFLHYSWEVECG